MRLCCWLSSDVKSTQESEFLCLIVLFCGPQTAMGAADGQWVEILAAVALMGYSQELLHQSVQELKIAVLVSLEKEMYKERWLDAGDGFGDQPNTGSGLPRL